MRWNYPREVYNAFALIYRPGAQTACEDLARAISFIFEHAEELNVDTDCYSLWGGSAGGRMAAWLGSYGPAAFGGDELPQPGAVVMQYTGHSDYTENAPPTFACDRRKRWHRKLAHHAAPLDAMSALGIPTEFHHYPGLPHGFGWEPARWQKDGWRKRLTFGRRKCEHPVDIV